MKKIIIILSLFLSFSSQIFSNIIFRRAVSDDAEQLMHMFKTDFTKDDKQKLLVFPDDMQKSIMNDAIREGKLFVAYDDKAGKIVSFLKLYVVNQHEINSILDEELCLGVTSPLINNYCYHFPESKEINFKAPIKPMTLNVETKDAFLSQSEEKTVRSGTDSCLYLYHGSAYTLPSYRGGGMATKLLMYAFNAIKAIFNDKKYYALLYGQVNANVGNHAMVRVFADTLQHAFSQQSTNGVMLQHLACRAYKPDFDNRGELKIICDKEHEGLGSMVVYAAKPTPRATRVVIEQKEEMKVATSTMSMVNATHQQVAEMKKADTSVLEKTLKMIYGMVGFAKTSSV